MEIVKYDKYEIKKITSHDEYISYVDIQNKRSGGHINHNQFIHDIRSYGITLDPSYSIIDVGCRGNAKVVIDLMSMGYENVYGIDIGYDAEIMWQDLLNGPLRGRLKRFDVHDGLGFDLKFNCITSSHTLEHCYDPKKVIEIFYNALHDDGILHLQIPLSNYNEYLSHKPHYAFWANESDFISWLDELGFIVVYSARRTQLDDFALILKKK
jgi:2-polyprenyl-3-methyl-5-hydroxy-6-metoxy-1,4-benzoquinol methylase